MKQFFLKFKTIKLLDFALISIIVVLGVSIATVVSMASWLKPADLYVGGTGYFTDTLHLGSGGTTTTIAYGLIVHSGKVGIGTTAPGYKLHLAADGPANLALDRASADIDGNSIAGLKSRGTHATPGIIAAGDDLLLLRGYGYDGASNREAARITMDTEGNVASTQIPGKIMFYTATDATPSVLTERMRINSAGNVGIGITDPGTYKLKVAGKIQAQELCLGTDCSAAWPIKIEARSGTNWYTCGGSQCYPKCENKAGQYVNNAWSFFCAKDSATYYSNWSLAGGGNSARMRVEFTNPNSKNWMNYNPNKTYSCAFYESSGWFYMGGCTEDGVAMSVVEGKGCSNIGYYYSSNVKIYCEDSNCGDSWKDCSVAQFSDGNKGTGSATVDRTGSWQARERKETGLEF